MRNPLLVTGLLVLVATADNKLRMAPLTMKQSARVRRFVTTLHGGSMRLDTKDLLLMTEADALETFGRLTGKLPLKERFRRALGNLIHGKSPVPDVLASTSNSEAQHHPEWEPESRVAK